MTSHQPSAPTPARVVVTGIGMLTPLGSEPETLLAALDDGQCGVMEYEDFIEGKTARAGRVMNIPVKELIRSPHLRRMDRVGRMSVVASTLALRHAGLGEQLPCPAERAAIGWATELASTEETWRFQERVRTKGPRLANPLLFPNLVHNAAAGYLSIIHDLKGPSATFCHHECCAFEALSWGVRQLKLGRADMVLAGVTEELGPLLFQVRSLFAIRQSPGEGAAALVLEREDDARARGARILARIVGEAVVTTPLPPYRYADDEAAHAVLEAALERVSTPPMDLKAVIGIERQLVDAVGSSAVLPLLHLAAVVIQGKFPAAAVARARGGNSRAFVLEG